MRLDQNREAGFDVEGRIIDAQGVSTPLSGNDFTARLPREGFFWIDITSASEDDIAALATALKLDDTLSAWLPRFGQSARFEARPQYLRISTWADAGSRGVIEGHILHSPAWLITLFDGPALRMDAARLSFQRLSAMIAAHPAYALVIVLDELVTGFYPRLERADELLDQLEDQVFLAPAAGQLLSLADLRRELSSLHRLLVPLRDRVNTLLASTGGVPGISAEVAPWFQTYSERLADLIDLIEDYRQRTTEAMDSYGVSLANRQSEQINRLTVISWVFLPITFLTGYFGMNFNWAVNELFATRDDFLLLGVELPLLSLTVTLLLFKSLGWIGALRRKRLQSAAVGRRDPGGVGMSSANRKADGQGLPTLPAATSREGDKRE